MTNGLYEETTRRKQMSKERKAELGIEFGESNIFVSPNVRINHVLWSSSQTQIYL